MTTIKRIGLALGSLVLALSGCASNRSNYDLKPIQEEKQKTREGATYEQASKVLRIKNYGLIDSFNGYKMPSGVMPIVVDGMRNSGLTSLDDAFKEADKNEDMIITLPEAVDFAGKR